MSIQEWTNLLSKREKRDCDAVCLHGDLIIVVNGGRGPICLDTYQVFSSKSKRCVLPRPLSAPDRSVVKANLPNYISHLLAAGRQPNSGTSVWSAYHPLREG